MKSQSLGLRNLKSGKTLQALIFSIMLFMQIGCVKQMGQHPCAVNECYGQDVWQQAIDHIAAHNFPEEQYIGKVYSDRLNNAWTTDDNKVNISEDLLTKLIHMGDAYILSVSAHEIAHIRSHHYSLKASLSQVSLLGSLDSDHFSRQKKKHEAEARLSRKHELEADKLAVQYMEKAGYHRKDYLKFLKWMEKNLKDASPSELATHPRIKERIARVEEPTSFLISRGPSHE